MAARPWRVVVGVAQVPFQRGGAEWHAAEIVRQLAARGYRAELVQVPFQWSPREQVLRSALAWRLLDLTQAGGEPIDLLIGTRFPSYAARHPNKVLWLFHPFRQAYDLHESGVDGFPDTPEGRALRAEVVALDTRALRECRRLFTTSATNAARLRRFNGVEAEVLRLPLGDARPFRGEAWEPYVLWVGRLEALKRPELLVRAAAHLPAAARAVLVGEGSQRDALERLAAGAAPGKVELRGYVDEAELRALYARAGAVLYAPWDEDYGLVTLEAFAAGKPVVTTVDAGGVLEFVRDGETGLVTAAAPEALAAAVGRLLADPALAARLGARGREETRGLSWDAVVESLTATLR